ncbi:MAG: hypothetical protein DRH11_04555 [Deltaproteobacteria bacterium]|nr:MAG: hypothetical protein DRH11_04555 [Deltaproteobacteria bacterium]
MCHQVQGDQFKAGKHAPAWSSMKAMPTAHWQPMAMMEGMKGCGRTGMVNKVFFRFFARGSMPRAKFHRVYSHFTTRPRP